MTDFHETLRDAGVYISFVVWLPGMTVHPRCHPALVHLLSRLRCRPTARLYQDCPELLPFIGRVADPDADPAEELGLCLRGRPGFIFEAVADNFALDCFNECSVEWFYAATEDEMTRIASEWAKAERDRWYEGAYRRMKR